MLPGITGSAAFRAAARAGAADAGGVSGTARAAAQVTPIEQTAIHGVPRDEVRNPRMLTILDIVRQICPSVN
ncbi:hypothetical protein GCM10010260_75260 [Streptomyces filipinensis]|uniref:Uncharacterized protein n=1 Tax=Streptomyces filipinensis TaxID=66887 RepID=A0A918MFK3_9ACTN|nr:hypothetical protein GCM10010260_75260 [Streptomyces filipinensis]